MTAAAQSRPRWVGHALADMNAFEGDIAKLRNELAEFALWLKGKGVGTGEPADAAHDLEHAERHIVSMRRALAMSWPDEDRA